MGQLFGWMSAYDGWDESEADQLSGRCFGDQTSDQQKLTRSKGDETALRRIKLVLALAGFGLIERRRRAERKLRRKDNSSRASR